MMPQTSRTRPPFVIMLVVALIATASQLIRAQVAEAESRGRAAESLMTAVNAID